MNVIEIIELHLLTAGFDGLFNSDGECACLITDLAPCEMLNRNCEPGYKTHCDCEGTPCKYHISAKKGDGS